MKRVIVLMLVAALGACGGIPPAPDTARMPVNALGSNADPDVYSANIAAWAFSDASRTFGRPIEAMRAAAALDYLAGQINTSPRWQNISATTMQSLLQARIEMRMALGIAPGAPSQDVVDSLTRAANALAAGNQAGALAVLGPPVFPAGADKTLALLSNMPYMRTANVATQRLVNEMFDASGKDWL